MAERSGGAPDEVVAVVLGSNTSAVFFSKADSGFADSARAASGYVVDVIVPMHTIVDELTFYYIVLDEDFVRPRLYTHTYPHTYPHTHILSHADPVSLTSLN